MAANVLRISRLNVRLVRKVPLEIVSLMELAKGDQVVWEPNQSQTFPRVPSFNVKLIYIIYDLLVPSHTAYVSKNWQNTIVYV